MEALAITSILVARDPDSAQSQEVHALALISEGWRHENSGNPEAGTEKWAEALDAYILACDQSTTAGLLQLSTAQLAHMLGEIPIAKKYYELAHQNVFNDARASFFLAQIELLNSQWEPAKRWITQSLKRNPNEPFALLSLALIEAELGNTSVAVELATQGCNLLPEEPNLRFIQARVLRLAGNPEQALEILIALPKPMLESPMCKGEFDSCLAAIEKGE
jgi:tetratricopeptide (TPR) repeat protein